MSRWSQPPSDGDLSGAGDLRAAPLLSALALVLFESSCFAGGPAVTQGDRPNLGIADDESAQQAAITLREVHVRNLGMVSGEGTISVTVSDSLGAALIEVFLQDGAAVRVPAVDLGGAEGRVVPMSAVSSLKKLVDSLTRAGSRFALRVRIRTTGGDADESDNERTREWAPWLPITPGADVTMRFTFAVPNRARAARVAMELLDQPPGARVVYEGLDGDHILPAGPHTLQLHLLAPDDLPNGRTFTARVMLTNSETGEVLQQHERVAIFDTVPPMLSSYRAVLLRDGRIAIQVRAGDRHAGVWEGGVATQYSLDGGLTWHRQVHEFATDDFGRPALFQTALGPFPPGAALLIGIRAADRAGNVSDRLPVDCAVFRAPRNAEMVVDTFGFTDPDGNPVFAPTSVARRATGVETVEMALAHLIAYPPTHLSPTERFELRNCE